MLPNVLLYGAFISCSLRLLYNHLELNTNSNMGRPIAIKLNPKALGTGFRPDNEAYWLCDSQAKRTKTAITYGRLFFI